MSVLFVKGKLLRYTYVSPGCYEIQMGDKRVTSCPSPAKDGTIIIPLGECFGTSIKEDEATHQLSVVRN